MSKKLANVLTVAGFDPSGGAGLLADAKTFDAHNVLGMGVMTANTFQTEDRFEDISWIKDEDVLKQLDLLLGQYSFDVVKIGLIPSLELLNLVLARIRKKTPGAFIVWDPVLKATAGFTFHNGLSDSGIAKTLELVDLVTPNAEEYELIKTSEECIWLITSVRDSTGDELLSGSSVRFYKNQRNATYEKHGSGCVLSSAIAANIARGYTLHKSILRAKDYMYHYLNSSKSLLGQHHRS